MVTSLPCPEWFQAIYLPFDPTLLHEGVAACQRAPAFEFLKKCFRRSHLPAWRALSPAGGCPTALDTAFRPVTVLTHVEPAAPGRVKCKGPGFAPGRLYCA